MCAVTLTRLILDLPLLDNKLIVFSDIKYNKNPTNLSKNLNLFRTKIKRARSLLLLAEGQDTAQVLNLVR